MLKKDEIYEACKNILNKFKNLDNEDFIAKEPSYNWIQTDPEKLKAKGVIKDIKFLTISIIECENINKQKRKMKEIIFNEELTASSLLPLLVQPHMLKNINDKNIKNYTRWLINKDPVIGKIGISEEINQQNMAIILQQYSVSKIISSVFQECLKNLGVSKIWDRANALAQDNYQNVLKIIPLISNDGILDESKLSDEYKIFLQLKAEVDNAFLDDE
tara:strand:- start:97 stop:747 length:651 start_codon:yes stop_codon:yes gene_type:complete